MQIRIDGRTRLEREKVCTDKSLEDEERTRQEKTRRCCPGGMVGEETTMALAHTTPGQDEGFALGLSASWLARAGSSSRLSRLEVRRMEYCY